MDLLVLVHTSFPSIPIIPFLKPNGVLVFKWNEEQISFSDVLHAIGCQPLFGDKRGKTRWNVFAKEHSSELTLFTSPAKEKEGE